MNFSASEKLMAYIMRHKRFGIILMGILVMNLVFGFDARLPLSTSLDTYRYCKNKLMKKILVLCTGNSCRSQIAEGYLRHFAGGEAEVYSAGVETHGVNSRAVQTMKEDGIDISQHTSNNMAEYKNINFDFIITVCDHAKERCPFFPTTAKKFHQNFPDPAKARGTEEEIRQQFREVRNMIKAYCREFVATNL